MEGRGAYLRVGLLIAAGFALLIGLVFFISGSRYENGRTYESYFKESVQGLEVGAPVKYRGVTLGKVTSIGLVSAEYADSIPAGMPPDIYREVFVRFVVDPKKVGRLPDTETAVKTGLRARLAAQGLTGLSYIELDFASPDQFPEEKVPWTPDEEYIPSMPSTLTQVQDAAEKLLAKLDRVDLDRMAATVQDALTRLDQSLTEGDAHQVLTGAEALLGALRGSVERADLPALADDLRRMSAAARGLVESRQTRETLANLDAASARLPGLIAALEATARRADSGTADVQQQLGPTLRDAQAAVANLRDVTETLRQYPAQVLLGGPPPRAENRR